MSFFDDASLAFLPSGGAGKDTKAYSIKPTDGSGDFTFSRGSNLSATRVGPTGLIEKGRENLLLQSNQFDTTWSSLNSPTLTSGQEDKDGGTNAWKFSATSSGSDRAIYQNTTGLNIVVTSSFYAKKGSVDFIYLASTRASSSQAQWFDLANGTLGTKLGSDIIASNIESVGNGWYRCSVTSAPYTAGYSFIALVDGDNSQTSSNGDFVYIQDAQLEIGLAATDYIESGATTGKAGLLEDEPRFDYSGGATCPSLLLEPSRTQYLGYTEYLDPANTNWAGYPTGDPVTHTQNYAIAPDGTQTASLLGNFTTAGFNIVNNSNFRTSTLVSQNPLDDTYTISVWLKTTSGTGTITLLNRGLASGTNSPQYIQCNVTNEWQRFYVSNTYTAAENASSLGFTIIRNGVDTLEEVLVWGAQTELGSYPTSYIPNHSGGSVTRGLDVCTGAGDAATFNDSEGVFYAEISTNTDDTDKALSINNSISGGSNSRLWMGYSTTAKRVHALGYVNNSIQFVLSKLMTDETLFVKIACKYALNDVSFFVNGEKVGTDTSALEFIGLNSLDFNIGNATGGSAFYGKAKQVLYFTETLSDTDLETLTTL